jgi:hypothetical protein
MGSRGLRDDCLAAVSKPRLHHVQAACTHPNKKSRAPLHLFVLCRLCQRPRLPLALWRDQV